jgi:hypothetical protein
MDIFGVLRVTWLPRARHPGPPAVPAELSTVPAQPPDSGPPVPDPPVAESAATGPLADIVRDLIGLADVLLDFTDHPPAGPEASVRTLRLLQRRVDRLLTDCGVRIVGDEGPVVPSRHEVVGARPTGEEGIEGWIAATVRPGYLHGEQLIRPQQVVAYSAGQPAGAKERNNNSEG